MPKSSLLMLCVPAWGRLSAVGLSRFTGALGVAGSVDTGLRGGVLGELFGLHIDESATSAASTSTCCSSDAMVNSATPLKYSGDAGVGRRNEPAAESAASITSKCGAAAEPAARTGSPGPSLAAVSAVKSTDPAATAAPPRADCSPPSPSATWDTGVDEWASSARPIDGEARRVSIDAGAGGFSENSDSRIFTLDLLEQNAAKGHGLVTSVSAGNNAVLVGTSKGWVVRHDFGGDDRMELDLSTSRAGDQYVYKVFLDPTGRHCLAILRSGTAAETFYIHARWKKPRALSKLKNVIVNTVAWNKAQISESSSGEILLGAMGGQVYEMLVEEKDKKEKYVKQLFELTESKEPILGLQMDSITTTSTTIYFVMAATPTRLYAFVGSGSAEAVFARPVKCVELPGDFQKSELHFYGRRHAESFAWLAGPGIYHGQLNISTQHSDDSFIGSKWLLEYSRIRAEGTRTQPTAISLTEHHFLLLYEGRLKAVNRLSQKLVEDDLQTDVDTSLLGLCADYVAGAYYAYDETSIFEITVRDEDRDIWQIYLQMKEYAAALEHCKTAFQKDSVYEAQADEAFEARKYMVAASFYAKIKSVVSFEEIALKFWKINELDALRSFLLRKLDSLGKDDRSQTTMVSTWTAELYLDKMNQLSVDDKGGRNGENAEYDDVVKEFRAFLSDCKDVLDEATTMKLLASYGRNEELVYFAGLKNQYETVVNHHIQQHSAKKALSVLRKGNVAPDVLYKFAPALMILDAKGTVDFLMSFPGLNPQEFIPALMRYSAESHPKDEAHQAIRYLEFCILQQQNVDPTIHNLMVFLLVKQGDEKALLRFLEAKYAKGKIIYNPNYALRLCLEEKRETACIFLYSMMGLHQEAVALALKVNVDLAKVYAEKVEDDEELRKKLWLLIAKHVIKEEKGENIKKAVDLVKETDGLLKIEDMLPFFPEFALINAFQEPIQESLQAYSSQIEELKLEMNEATLGAEKLRKDINALGQRHATLDADELCGVCHKKVLALEAVRTPIYVFPCEHCFHDDCLVGHVIRHTDRKRRDRIMELKKKLSVLSVEATTTSSNKQQGKKSHHQHDESVPRVSSLDQAQTELDEIVAAECPYCGEMMIREISRPFIAADEADYAASWEIGGGFGLD